MEPVLYGLVRPLLFCRQEKVRADLRQLLQDEATGCDNNLNNGFRRKRKVFPRFVKVCGRMWFVGCLRRLSFCPVTWRFLLVVPSFMPVVTMLRIDSLSLNISAPISPRRLKIFRIPVKQSENYP